MASYLLRRVAAAVAVVFLVMLFLAVLVHLIPGNPAYVILGPRATPQLAAEVQREMGLDRPITWQVAHFIKGALTGNLGHDFIGNVPVGHLVAQALPHTLILAFASLLVAGAIGIPLGVHAATRPGSVSDRIIGVVSISMISVPQYVVALLLLLLFAVRLRWLPAVGAGSLSHPGDYIKHLILPACALAIAWVGYLARLVRANMLEVASSGYIRTAYAHGIPEWRVQFKYALRNAIIPAVSILGIGFGNLIGGAVFIEIIFARPGVGTLIVNAVTLRNYPVVQGSVLVIALILVGANLVADITNSVLDPRTRAKATRRR